MSEVDCTPVLVSRRELQPLAFRQVRRTPDEHCFNSLLESYHYFDYTQPVGEQLKFMVYAGSRPVALFAWSSAARHLGPRDRYFEWVPEVRRQNIRFLAYNTRYLILPWIQASHLLACMTRVLSAEWEKVYGHPVYFAETFVDSTRHRGTCYRAANWMMLGRTQGRGKDDLTHKPNRTLKDVLVLRQKRVFPYVGPCEAGFRPLWPSHIRKEFFGRRTSADRRCGNLASALRSKGGAKNNCRSR